MIHAVAEGDVIKRRGRSPRTDKERKEQLPNRPRGTGVDTAPTRASVIRSPDRSIARRETFSGRKESAGTRARPLSRSDTPYPFDFD